VLSQRLRGLEEAGIVERRTLPPPAHVKVYELTPAGLELEPVLIALGRWGGTHAPESPECGMSLDSHILSMRTLFDPALAEGFETRVQLEVEGTGFRAEVCDGDLEIEYGRDPSSDAVVRSDPRTLIDVLHSRIELEDAIESGDLEIEGDEEAARRFLRLCPLPQPAEV
jgi:DNA-binding MarR family transcriptional regulator